LLWAWEKNICGAGDWLSLVSRVSCLVKPRAVEPDWRGASGVGLFRISRFLAWAGKGRVEGSGPGEPGEKNWDSLGLDGRRANHVIKSLIISELHVCAECLPLAGPEALCRCK
jgi:hypothetical protein